MDERDGNRAGERVDNRVVGSLQAQTRRNSDRRKKQDWVVRSATIIAIVGWICAIVAVTLIDRASPPQRYELVASIHGGTAAGHFNVALLRWAFIATLASFLVSIIGLLLNATRHRRKTDRYNKLLIGICIASTVIFAVYLVRYAGYL